MYSDYGKASEQLERNSFDLLFWKERLIRARAYRMSCGWESAANDSARIRKNDLPLREIKAAPGWKGKFYKDNWLWKGIKWIVSMLTGSNIHVDLKAFDGFGDESMDVYEGETNYHIEQSNLLNVLEDCLYDRYYPGLGVARATWNTKRITPVNQTGKPIYEYVNPMDIYLDPHTRMKDKSDMRYFFHVMQYDTEELRRMYPQYADIIQSGIDEKRLESTGTTKVVVLQYKKTITIEKIFIQDEVNGISVSFLAEEWYKHVETLAADPASHEMWAQSKSELSFQEWLEKGGWLDEAVTMTGPLEVEESAVYQGIFIPEIDTVLQSPQYIGQEYSYFFMCGYHNPDCAYPYGLAFFMKDMLEISVIIMTVLTIQAVKMYKMEKIIQGEALINDKEYKEHGYELGTNPIVRSDWQKANPGVKAVEYLQLPEFPSYIMALNESIAHAQKTMTGAVDSAIGVAQYSGQSGVQVAQLQAASRIYQKEEVEGFRRFIESASTWMKDMIALYRNYPHKIKGITEDNRIGLVEVATTLKNRLNAELYYVEVTIQESHEVVKQVERELYNSLKNDKLISPLEYLRHLDIPNADKKLEEAQAYYGDLEYLELIKKHPEIKQVIEEFLQQMQSGEGKQNEQAG